MNIRDLPIFLIGLLAVDAVIIVGYSLQVALFGDALASLDLDKEASVPTWWSSVQFLVASAALFGVAHQNLLSGRLCWALGGLAGFLLAMSIDEVASFHETAGAVLDTVTGDRTGTTLHRTGFWFVILGVPAVSMAWIIVRRARSALEDVPGTTARLGLGFGLLFCGSFGVEGMANLVPDGAGYAAAVVLEEGLELIGGTILCWACLVFAYRHPALAELHMLLGRPAR